MRNDNLEKILSYLQNVQETKVIQAIKEELLQYGDGALGFMLKFMAVSATEEERTAEQNLDLIKEAIEQYETLRGNSLMKGNLITESGSTTLPAPKKIDTEVNSPIHHTASKPRTVVEQDSQFKNNAVKEYAAKLKEGLVVNQASDDFVEFVGSGNLYVDKSLFIKHILDNGDHLFITCPRRWGKSLNLSMLKAFLQPDGECNRYNKDGKYDFGSGNKNARFFQNLKIQNQNITKHHVNEGGNGTREEVKIVEAFQGQYPVIYLNFKSVKGLKGNPLVFDFGKLESDLRNAVSEAFKEHGYLYKKLLLGRIASYCENKMLSCKYNNNTDLSKLESYINDNSITISMDLQKLQAYYSGEAIAKAPLSESIKFLADLLYQHYGRKVFILVDEFDKPVNSILSSGNFLDNIETAKKVAECVSNIISPCSKGNNSVQQIVLTGILNSEVKEPSSSINNLHHKGVMTGDIVEYFGFNDEEVKWLLDQSFTGLTETEESALFEKLKYWYNGQIIGSQNTGVFTPSSVMRYIGELRDFKNSDLASKTPDFKCYWSSTENVSMLQNFAKIAHEKKYQEVLDKLVKISYNQTVEYNHSPDDQLYTILDLGLNSSSNFERLVFYYLSRSGYITKTAKENMYKLPAREVQKSFKEQVQDYWLQKIVFKTNWDAFENVAEEVDFCDDNLPTSLSKAMNLVSKDYENFNEDTFKCILHSIFSMSKKRDEASISIEPHTGKGYIDMVLYFHKKALIFELKFNNDTQSDRIDRILSDELYQILDKGYLKLVLSKLDEKDKSDIQEIRLISLLLYRIGTNAEWLCKKQEIKLEREAAVTVREFLDKFGIKEKLNSEAGSKLKKEFLEIISDSDKERLSNKLNQLAVEIQDGQAPRQGKASKRKGGAISHDYGESDQSILRYRSAELDRVLRIRMSDERVNHNDVVVIDTHKKYEYPNTTANVIDLLQKIEAQLSLRGKDRETLILVPYAYQDHFIGLAFVVGGDIVMNYLDPENQELDDDFLAEMNKSGIKINKIKVGQQKYNNCGIEVIENFIGFLKKENLQKRSISQEKAIAIHQRLSMEFRAELSENTKRIKGSMDSLCNDVLGNLCTNFVLLNSTDNIRNDNSLLDNLQQHFLIFYQATQRDNHKILLPILEGDRWSIALIEIKAIPQTIVIKSFGNRALSQGMQSSLKDLLQAAIYGVMEDNDLWKPRTRMLGMDGKSVQTKRYILDYGIEVEDKFDDRIKSAEELVAHVYHEVTGRDQSSRSGFDRTEIHNASSRLVGFSPATTTQPSMFFGNQQSATNMIYPEKQANSNSRGQSTAASRLSFFGNQNNRQTDDNPAARMDIEKRLHPPLNSIFSEPKSNNLFETSQQSNKSLMKESIETSEQKGFSGDFFGPRDNKSAYNFF